MNHFLRFLSGKFSVANTTISIFFFFSKRSKENASIDLISTNVSDKFFGLKKVLLYDLRPIFYFFHYHSK